MNDSYNRGRTGRPPRRGESMINYYAGEDDARRARGLKPIGLGGSGSSSVAKLYVWTIVGIVAAIALFALAYTFGW